MAKLKPCPFCGGEASYNEKKVLIECERCRATIYGHKIYKHCWRRYACNNSKERFTTKEEVKEKK